jgi:type II secretory pathway component GspD/PulD (secretin)
MPALPLTQLDERGGAADLDNRTFSLTFAQPVPITDLLLMLVRGTSLSVVPDPAIAGASFIGELKNVTVRQALSLILPALGLGYSLNGSIIRVSKRTPETRIFHVNYPATERSSASIVSGGDGRSTATVKSETKTDLFDELTRGVQTLLSKDATFNVDRKAGLVQVTDAPERLDRVARYLDTVQDRVGRQARLDVRVLDVALKDEKASGIDWSAVSNELAAALTPAQRAAGQRSLSGLRVTDPAKLIAALGTQGTVRPLSSERLFALNNEPAILKTEGTTITLTPQVSGDAAVVLTVTPLIKTPAVIEADIIARVADGETLVLWGFTRDRETRERKNVGLSGGWFGRSTIVTHRTVETIILITPSVVAGAATN